MKQLSRDDRLTLLRFVCSFAWADLRVSEAERALVTEMIRRLHFDAEERAQVNGWLKVPPAAEEVDPTAIPDEHRQLFLDAARAVIQVDGRVSQVEADSYELLRELLG